MQLINRLKSLLAKRKRIKNYTIAYRVWYEELLKREMGISYDR